MSLLIVVGSASFESNILKHLSDKALVLEQHQVLRADGRHLEISYAQLTDTALYTCVATNAVGNTQQTFELEILGKLTSSRDTNVLTCELYVRYIDRFLCV